MSTFLDQLLSGGGGGGPASPFTDVREYDPGDVTTPGAGIVRMFNDPAVGLAFRRPDGGLRPVESEQLHLRRFVAGNTYLNPGNFEATLHTAYTEALALDTPAQVVIPRGVWQLSAGFTVLGRGSAGNMPDLVGAAGRSATVLEWPAGFTGDCIHVDGFQDQTETWLGAYAMTLRGLTLRIQGGPGAARSMVRLRQTVFMTFRDMLIQGNNRSNNDGWDTGIGIWMDGNDPITGLENVQNTYLSNVVLAQCTVGMKMRGGGPTVAANLICNQNAYADIVIVDGSSIGIHGGMLQSSYEYGAGSTYYGQRGYSIRIVGAEVANGTSAALSAPSGGKVTVTGLTGAGLTADCINGHYIRFSDATDPGNNGLWEVTDYLSPTSCMIRKPNGTAETVPLWYAHRNRGGSRVSTSGYIFHEGNCGGLIKTAAPTVTNDKVSLSGHELQDCDELGSFNRTDVNIGQMFGSPTTRWITARNCRSIIADGLPDPLVSPSAYDLDAYSRFGLVIRGDRGRIYTGQNPTGKSLHAMLAQYCTEVWDASRRVTLATDGCVQSWTGLIGGTVLTAPASGQRPIMISAQPDLGGQPAIGNRYTGARMLSGTLANAIPVGSYWGLLVVGVIPRGGRNLDGTKRGPSVFSGDVKEWRNFAWQDGDGANINAFVKTGDSFAGISGPSAIPVGAPAVLHLQTYQDSETTGPTGERLSVMGETGIVYTVDQSSLKLATVSPVTTVQTCGNPGDTGNSNDFDIALIAVFQQQVSTVELLEIMRLCAEKYCRRAPRHGFRPAQTGTITVVGANSTVYVDVSGSAATVNLPAGCLAGDEITVKLTSAATNSCTIDPAGSETVEGASTLVLSTGYASVTLRFNGNGNWYVVAKS